MNIDKIKNAYKALEKLEKIQHDIKELEKSDTVDSITIKRVQMGIKQYSYEVLINDDSEFLKTVKSLIQDYLKRKEKNIIFEIENF